MVTKMNTHELFEYVLANQRALLEAVAELSSREAVREMLIEHSRMTERVIETLTPRNRRSADFSAGGSTPIAPR